MPIRKFGPTLSYSAMSNNERAANGNSKRKNKPGNNQAKPANARAQSSQKFSLWEKIDEAEAKSQDVPNLLSTHSYHAPLSRNSAGRISSNVGATRQGVTTTPVADIANNVEIYLGKAVADAVRSGEALHMSARQLAKLSLKSPPVSRDNVQIRMRADCDIEPAVAGLVYRQMELEYLASAVYQAAAAHLQSADVGFRKLGNEFLEESEGEVKHAKAFRDFLIESGVDIQSTVQIPSISTQFKFSEIAPVQGIMEKLVETNMHLINQAAQGNRGQFSIPDQHTIDFLKPHLSHHRKENDHIRLFAKMMSETVGNLSNADLFNLRDRLEGGDISASLNPVTPNTHDHDDDHHDHH